MRPSAEDGRTIANVLIYKHGLALDRVKALSESQRCYIEELLCAIIQNLSDHLKRITESRNNNGKGR